MRVRADISEQGIKVHMMSPSNPHADIVQEVVFQVRSQDADAIAPVENRVHHPGLGLCRTADLMILTTDARQRQTDDFATFAPDVAVAVEVISPSNPGNDYITKLRDYPRMGVPVYVIIDPRDGTVTVHSGPDSASGEPRYADNPRRYKFGDAVPMGAWTIETAKFPRYRV
ncbi:Uma2 family endonuclease [Streptomyces sp. RK9]|uniref:Uma2 family endonuclease n=1 Tax=Streptomyces sp. RK9 TaxID=3239284 RepID=UPI003863AFD8